MNKPAINDIRVNWRLSDFCLAYGISRATFYRECHAKRLSYIKSGKATLIPVTVADNWQAARLAEAGHPHAA